MEKLNNLPNEQISEKEDDRIVEKLINRDEAISLLYQISGMVDKKYLDKLGEIIYCLQAEQFNFHIWGGEPGEASYLFLSPKSHRLIRIEREELKRIFKKYRYGLSASDIEERKRSAEEYDAYLQNLILKTDKKEKEGELIG